MHGANVTSLEALLTDTPPDLPSQDVIPVLTGDKGMTESNFPFHSAYDLLVAVFVLVLCMRCIF